MVMNTWNITWFIVWLIYKNKFSFPLSIEKHTCNSAVVTCVLLALIPPQQFAKIIASATMTLLCDVSKMCGSLFLTMAFLLKLA